MRNDIWGKRADGITKAVNDRIKRVKDFVTKAALSKFLPNLFNRIHFRRIGRNKKQANIFWTTERFGLMPGSAIAAKEDPVVRILVG